LQHASRTGVGEDDLVNAARICTQQLLALEPVHCTLPLVPSTVHDSSALTLHWVDVEPCRWQSMFRHRESQRQRQAQLDNFFADIDGPIFRDGRRLTSQGVDLNLFQERNGDSVGRNFEMFMKLVPTLEISYLVNDFLETVQLIARLHLEGTELILSSSWTLTC
jgi:hypothetical protein